MKFYFIALASLVLISCSDENENQPSIIQPSYYAPVSLSAKEKIVGETSSNFAWEFFREVNAAPENSGNFVLSPISANILLTSLANGTDEQTSIEILKALGYTDFDMTSVNSYLQKTVDAMVGIDPTSTVKFANSIWSECSVKQEFLNTLATYYSIESYPLGETAKDDINSWCNDKTNGMIPKIIDEVPYGLSLMLINATYFKGIWASNAKFDKNLTKKDKFYNVDGSTSKVAFMNNTINNSFVYWTDKTKMCALDFGNHAYKLWLILPDEDVTIDEATEDICNSGWNSYKESEAVKLSISLPKFEVKNKFDLRSSLQSLGINRLFDNCDFSKMLDGNFGLMTISQHSRFRIDEDGAEAAAITNSDYYIGVPHINNKEYELKFNRPFIYLIEGQPVGNILFIGKVESL